MGPTLKPQTMIKTPSTVRKLEPKRDGLKAALGVLTWTEGRPREIKDFGELKDVWYDMQEHALRKEFGKILEGVDGHNKVTCIFGSIIDAYKDHDKEAFHESLLRQIEAVSQKTSLFRSVNGKLETDDLYEFKGLQLLERLFTLKGEPIHLNRVHYILKRVFTELVWKIVKSRTQYEIGSDLKVTVKNTDLSSENTDPSGSNKVGIKPKENRSTGTSKDGGLGILSVIGCIPILGYIIYWMQKNYFPMSSEEPPQTSPQRKVAKSPPILAILAVVAILIIIAYAFYSG